MTISLEWRPKRGCNTTEAWTVPHSELTDEQWTLSEYLFVERPAGGRPRVCPQPCLDGINWGLHAADRTTRTPSFVLHFFLATTQRMAAQRRLLPVSGRFLQQLGQLVEIDREVAMADATFTLSKTGIVGGQDHVRQTDQVLVQA